MGGTDVNGQLKLAAIKFRSGNDFWPGPLTTTPGSGNYDPSAPVYEDAIRDFGEANIDPDQCLAYDKFYTIRKAEVIRYTVWWETCIGPNQDPVACAGASLPTNDELTRIYDWPAHGDVTIGQDYWLAPFYDADQSGQYNPLDGDTPWYDDILGRDDVLCGQERRVTLFGDETHWWVFNDKGNIHTETGGDPIGMEIRAQAFAFATTDEVNRMTFYNYEMINRGTQTLFNTYFSQYLDADVGNYADDYAGCDVSRGLGYAYNGDALDETNGGAQGYGENPPAIGVDFFEGPYQDADGKDNLGPDSLAANFPESQWVDEAGADDGIVYGGIGVGYSDGVIDNERYGMRLFTYYTNGAVFPTNDPGNAPEFYNYMRGLWQDGSQIFYGGNAYNAGVTSTPTTADTKAQALFDACFDYYIAVAYAYNDKRDTLTQVPNLYDPSDPLTIDGQQTPYIASRLNFDGTAISPIAAVPHNPMPEADGTGQLIEYGSSPIIRRLDGHGNGGRSLELTDASKETIIANGFMEAPEYDFGSGPINVKVVDPLNVKDGYYECLFRDYNTTSSNGADDAEWVIYRYESETATTPVDSISSLVTISTNNEQIIPEWGVSVQISQASYFVPDGAGGGVEARSTELLSSSITFEDSSLIYMTAVQDNDGFFPTNWIRSGTYAPETDPNELSYACLDNTLPTYRDYLDPCNYADWQAPNNFADPNKDWARILGGGIAPHKLVGFESSFMPMTYYNYGSPTSARNGSSISFLPSVDIVITNDRSKWTRCPVIELGREPALNVGGAEPGALRASPSVNKDGSVDSGSTGMGWFPGYAIDLETGARLYMAFGENSFLASENGADMIWNPTSTLVDNGGNPLMGGMHPVYVFSHKTAEVNNYLLGYDFPAYIPSQGDNDATNAARLKMLDVLANDITEKRNFYSSISWVAYPMATPNFTIDPTQGLPTDVTISLRVSKEYKNFTSTGLNNGQPMYSWNMSTVATELGSRDRLAEALDLINVVPNPYYAYSEYERNRLDTRVKITNLPERCTVKIYSVNGKLVRTFKKDSPVTSIDWDLNNWRGIPVAGGVYLIHVDVPDVGERIVKFFGGMRLIDLQGI